MDLRASFRCCLFFSLCFLALVSRHPGSLQNAHDGTIRVLLQYGHRGLDFILYIYDTNKLDGIVHAQIFWFWFSICSMVGGIGGVGGVGGVVIS